MEYNQPKGYSIIELLAVIAIVVILALSGGALAAYMVRNAIYIPSQLNMDMVASDILDMMINGDSQARGLRFSKFLTQAQPYQVSFMNQDNQTVTYELLTEPSRFVRYIEQGAQQIVPYYMPLSGISVSGKNQKMFEYYDANGALTDNPSDVRRIALTVAVQAGSGSYDSWEGYSEQISAVAVTRFQ